MKKNYELRSTNCELKNPLPNPFPYAIIPLGALRGLFAISRPKIKLRRNLIMKKSTHYLVQSAVIAALYAVLTIGQNVLLPGTASMAVQFRVAEVMTVLAFFTNAAIPGLTLGCIIANISSVTAGLGFYDMIFGSVASLLAALTMYALRNVRIKNLPIVGVLMPAIFNGIIVGFEIDFFFVGSMSFNFTDFLYQGGCVALGELAVLVVLGLPLTAVVERTGLNKKLFRA